MNISHKDVDKVYQSFINSPQDWIEYPNINGCRYEHKSGVTIADFRANNYIGFCGAPIRGEFLVKISEALLEIDRRKEVKSAEQVDKAISDGLAKFTSYVEIVK